MADNDVTITVDADNRTTAAFGAAARGARTVGEATQNANRALQEAGQRAEAASLRLQQLASRQREAADRARFLQTSMNTLRSQIASTGDATGELTAELRQLGRQEEQARLSARLLENQHRSSTEQVNDLARAYQRAQRNAEAANIAARRFGSNTILDRNGNVITSNGDRNRIMPRGDDDIGFLRRIIAGLPGGLGSAAGTGANAATGGGNPLLTAAMLGLGAGAVTLGAPFIGGLVTGGVGAAAAIGGVGLGLSGAIANDPKAFEQQWTGVTERVRTRWLTSSRTWVVPAHDAIREVDGMLRKLPIESVLRNSAAYLMPLTKGVTGFGEGLFTGLDRLVANAGPIVDMLEKRLPKFGQDLGQSLAALAEGSEGGALALDDLLYAAGRLTKGLGVTLAALANMYKATRDGILGVMGLADRSTEFAAGLLDQIPILDQYAGKVRDLFGKEEKKSSAFVQDLPGGRIPMKRDPMTGEIEKVPKLFGEATDAVDEYLNKLDEMRDRAAGAANASVALAQGWLDLDKELRNGKRTLDLTTQAGIDNTSALIQQAQAAEQARQQQINLNGDVEAANAAYEANIERIKAMAKALGFNDAQVDTLIESLRVLDTTVAKPEVNLSGVKPALDQGYSLGNLLNRIERTYTATVKVVTYGAGISLGNALRHNAIGGPTTPGPAVINEWGGQSGIGGGEVVSLPTGSMVYGGAKAKEGGSAGLGAAGSTVRVQLEIVSDGSDQGDYIADQLAKTVRVRGNGNVQLAVMGKA